DFELGPTLLQSQHNVRIAIVRDVPGRKLSAIGTNYGESPGLDERLQHSFEHAAFLARNGGLCRISAATGALEKDATSFFVHVLTRAGPLRLASQPATH